MALACQHTVFRPPQPPRLVSTQALNYASLFHFRRSAAHHSLLVPGSCLHRGGRLLHAVPYLSLAEGEEGEVGEAEQGIAS